MADEVVAGLDHPSVVIESGGVGLIDLEVGGGGVEEEEVDAQVEVATLARPQVDALGLRRRRTNGSSCPTMPMP